MNKCEFSTTFEVIRQHLIKGHQRDYLSTVNRAAGVVFMDPHGGSCAPFCFASVKTSLFVIKVHIPPDMGLGLKVLQLVLISQCT